MVAAIRHFISSASREVTVFSAIVAQTLDVDLSIASVWAFRAGSAETWPTYKSLIVAL